MDISRKYSFEVFYDYDTHVLWAYEPFWELLCSVFRNESYFVSHSINFSQNSLLSILVSGWEVIESIAITCYLNYKGVLFEEDQRVYDFLIQCTDRLFSFWYMYVRLEACSSNNKEEHCIERSNFSQAPSSGYRVIAT